MPGSTEIRLQTSLSRTPPRCYLASPIPAVGYGPVRLCSNPGRQDGLPV